MPRDAPSSSSEGEVEEEAEVPTQQKAREPTMFQCPPGFVSFSQAPRGSALAERLSNNQNELWLIKAPSDFDPECFSGVKVPLSGFQTVKVPSAVGGASSGGGASAASAQRVFSILASSYTTSPLRLLTDSKQSSDKISVAPAFSGLLNVSENFGGGANIGPQVVAAAPAPTLPPGLKQRFQPFGCKAPVLSKRRVEEEKAEEEEEGRKKKKKKKEKRIKTEPEEADDLVKVEADAEVQEEVTTEVTEEKRKKKKKKKDKEREREEEEEGAELKEVKEEEVTVKSEPMDTAYGDQVDVKKKKKKKKKSKMDDD